MTAENDVIRKRLPEIQYEDVAGFASLVISQWRRKASFYGYDYEDLRNESYIAFLKAKERYDGSTKFLTYFATILSNHFQELFVCWYDKDRKDILGEASEEPENLMNNLFGYDIWNSLSIKIRKAPRIVLRALDFMINAPDERLKELGFRKKGSRGYRNNKKFCSILGYDPKQVDIMKEIKKFLEKEY